METIITEKSRIGHGAWKPLTRTGDGHSNSAGFTLLELMIVLGIVGLLITMAIPAYLKLQPHMRLKSAASEVSSALNLARMTAITKNTNMKVAFNESTDSFLIMKPDWDAATQKYTGYQTVRSNFDGEGWRSSSDRWQDIDIYTQTGSIATSPVPNGYAVIFKPDGTASISTDAAVSKCAIYLRNVKISGGSYERYRVTVSKLTGLVKVEKYNITQDRWE